jgi:hypothetical protein
MTRNFGLAVPEFVEQPLKTLPAGCDTPYDFHKLFLDDKFVDEMVSVSKQYAIRKGRMEVEPKLTHNTMRTSIAVMHMTGYLNPSNSRMYWEHREDTMNPFVKKAISRNMFTHVIQNTYFVERITPDPSDKF